MKANTMSIVPTLDLNTINQTDLVVQNDLQITSLVSSFNSTFTPLPTSVSRQKQLPPLSTSKRALQTKATPNVTQSKSIQPSISNTSRSNNILEKKLTSRSQIDIPSTDSARRKNQQQQQQQLTSQPLQQSIISQEPLKETTDQTDYVLIHSKLISTLVNDINKGCTVPLNKSDSLLKGSSSGSARSKTNSLLQKNPETSRSKLATSRSTKSIRTAAYTARSKLSTSRSTKSIRTAAYTARSKLSTSRSTKSIGSALYTTRSTNKNSKLYMPWKSEKKQHSNNKDTKNKNTARGPFTPWNKPGLSKKAQKTMQDSKKYLQNKDVDLVAQTMNEINTARSTARATSSRLTSRRQHNNQDQHTLDMIEQAARETMAEEFNALYNESLVEQAARLQLSRGGRYVKPLGVYDSLRGPAALYLKAKGEVAQIIAPPDFSTLGKTIGSSAVKTLASTVVDTTSTAADTYIKQNYSSSLSDHKIFKNNPASIKKYIENRILCDHDLRGESLLVPKKACFLKQPTMDQIRTRQVRASKFKLVKQLREDHVKNVNTIKMNDRLDSHNHQKKVRVEKEKRLGKVPQGVRIGGGFSSPYRKLRRKASAPSAKDQSMAAELRRRMNA